ncbi:hypothetical protein [Chitinophaga sp. MM2321]|uniref:hypothetical protein n=1 Tax=Chitinophaga sp. MM2321 TaxID=3137178 RepID=UPI0032D5ADCB
MDRIHIKKWIAVCCCFMLAHTAYAQNYSFERLENNPIIKASLLSGADGDNINGPTLIEAPSWLPRKLGKYYLYFAHHKGKYIRLAYADDLKGPWKIYKPGTLQLSDCKVCETGLPTAGNSTRHDGAESAEDAVTHVASPDILIDTAHQQLVMYFHCPLVNDKYKGQYTFRATSKDGIHFHPDTTVLGFSYFRVFKWGEYYYSLSRAGQLGRSADGIAAFEQGHNPFSAKQTKDNYIRHVAVKLQGDTLLVFYSRIGDAPERILLSRIKLNDDWKTWSPSDPVEIAAPLKDYEGADIPAVPSKAGLYYGKVQQLRDPYVFSEGKKLYLLYTVAGESGIAIGELKAK